MNKQGCHSNMFKDLNRPEGAYGDVYDKQTQALSRKVTAPYHGMYSWEKEIVRIVEEELVKELHRKLNI